MIECIKCGDPKLRSEFYGESGHTCKECVKAAQKVRVAERREMRKRVEWGKIRRFVLDSYGGANVEVNGMPVVVGGEFVGERGRMMFCEMVLKHRDWMKKNGLSEPDMVPDKGGD